MTDYLDSDTGVFKLTPRAFEGVLPVVTPTLLGVVTSFSSLSSVNMSCTTPVAAGSLVTVIIASRELVTSVTDSKGNTYNVDRSYPGGPAATTASIATSVITTPLTNTDTWTINYAAANLRHSINAFAWTSTDVVFLSGVDQTSANSGLTGTRGSIGSGNTPTTTSPFELVIEVGNHGGSPAGGNGAYIQSGQSSGGGTPSILHAKYYTTAAVDVQGINGLTGTTLDWAVVAATYKLQPPITDANTVKLVLTPTAIEQFAGTLLDANTVPLNFTVSGVDIHHVAFSIDANTVPILFTISYIDVPGPRLDVGTVYLTLVPTGTDIGPAITYTDAGTVYLDFDFGADDCHAILTPHWDAYISKRWQLDYPTERWEVTAVTKRWSVWIIGVAIDNPCPVPTFEAVF